MTQSRKESGKAGLPGGGSSNPSPVRASARLANSQPAAATAPAPVITPAATGGASYSPSNTTRAASLARRQAMSSRGKANLQSQDRTRNADMAQARTAAASVSNSDTTAEKKDCGCGCGGEKALLNHLLDLRVRDMLDDAPAGVEDLDLLLVDVEADYLQARRSELSG